MKRCPECGYRIKADLKRCPLCDGKMMEDRNMTGKVLHEQSHKAEGGACLLENEPAKQHPKPAAKEGVSKGKWANDAFSPMRLIPVLLVIIFALLQSCTQ